MEIQSIINNIPKKFFFEKIFEQPNSQKLLADIPLDNKNIKTNDLLNCSPILTKQQEQDLFRKYNYLRYKIIKDTMGFTQSKDGPKPKKATKLNRLKENSIKKLELLIEKMNDTRNIILKSNIRLSYKYINKFSSRNATNKEEYLSSSYLGIIKAIESFDYRKNIKFSTYCSYAIIHNLIKEKNKISRSSKLLNKNESISTLFSKEENYRELNYNYNKKIVQKILKTINKKSKRNCEIIKLYYGINVKSKTCKEISVLFGISKQRIVAIKNTIINEAKNMVVYDPL